MKIDYAIPARQVEALADGSFMAIGIGSDIVGLAEFPAPALVPMVVCLSCDPTEARHGVDHELTMATRGVNLEELATLSAKLQMEPGDNTPPGWRVRVILPVVAQFLAAQPGPYSVELRTDEDSRSVPIVVRDVSVPPQP